MINEDLLLDNDDILDIIINFEELEERVGIFKWC